MCAQRRLRSAWASAQSDQNFRCPHEESLGPYLPTERASKTMIRLVLVGRDPAKSLVPSSVRYNPDAKSYIFRTSFIHIQVVLWFVCPGLSNCYVSYVQLLLV